MKLSVEALQELHNRRHTLVVPHNPLWPQSFQPEAAALKTIFGDYALTIQHIGSTAIPGLSAKPVVDILITTPDLDEIDTLDDRMLEHGYVAGGEFGLPHHRFFCKGNDTACLHHVHVYEPHHPSVNQYLLFRDYVSTHVDTAKAYEALKIDLAKRYPHDRTKYTQGKNEFIQEVCKKLANKS